nr:cobalamin-binding protein [Pseudomonas cremoricolorata]
MARAGRVRHCLAQSLLGLSLLFASSAQAALSRVVSLAPALTEMMIELDAQDLLVGVVEANGVAAPLPGLPSVGTYGALNMERLVSLKPDLVLLWEGGVSPAELKQLQNLGIASLSIVPRDLDQLIDKIEALAVRLGRSEQGRQHAAALRTRLQALRAQYRRAEPLKVFYQVWDNPLYTLGGKQIISNALRVCGARNVFEDLDPPAPMVSVESVIERDPQVILGNDQAQLNAWKARKQVDAVAHARLLVVPDNGIERPSGQMIEATAKLCALIETTAPASK